MFIKLLFLLPFAITSANVLQGYNIVNQTFCITKQYNTGLTLEDERLLLNPSKCLPKIYFVMPHKVNWFEAFILCQQSNMELASVESAEEEKLIEEAIKNEPTGNGFWISATKLGSGNNAYVFFTTGKPVIYHKYGPGQPDNAKGIEECIEIYKSGTEIYWNDLPCKAPEHIKKFICDSRCNL